MNNSIYRSPLVSVVMSVYNNEEYLQESIESILNQSFKDYEFLIINDGSQHDVASIIHKYTDPRIKFFDFKENEGTIKRLNFGFGEARGKYITIMDSDDVSNPERFQKCVEFLEKNPDHGMCSAFFERIDRFGNIISSDFSETSNERIKLELMFRCKIAQDTVLIRKDVVVKNNLKYDANYRHAEDYKMWYEVSKVTKLAVIPEPMLKYRSHPGQVSSLYTEIQKERCFDIVREQLNALGIKPSEKEMEVHTILGRPWLLKDYKPDYLTEAQAWIQKIEESNFRAKLYDALVLKEYLNEVFERVKQVWELTKPGCYCSLCHSIFQEFYFVPLDIVQQWDYHQYIHSIFALETFNIFQYECPSCSSNDMERLSFLYLEGKQKVEKSTLKVLSLSLNPIIKNYFITQAPGEWEYKEHDLLSMSPAEINELASESFDVLLCINRLQMADDDENVIRQLYRILKPEGFGIVMAPIQLTLDQTYEDKSVVEESERWKHFGHSFHRRLYSKKGFISNLENAGFKVKGLGINDFDSLSFEKYGIHPRSVLYVVSKA